ncbi:alpha/beta hydrolase-fold protein [Micromonospora sp. WMMA1363]|uniref:alpha/beta hydrolase n=1 Tax=Micromonospora sp. WMMA1363 TaxID=3053985 RepID=UPI00259CF69A|nr:alpha/beta hydrolase-fold protein [Micromonospora sp. WMMA1363]MDM4718243.1 alpha/beta hydrolase-fold protein [Micromonospora sp. WMMA1363]
MGPLLSIRRTGAIVRSAMAAATAAVVAMTGFAGSVAHADPPEIPSFTDGYGLTLVGSEVHSSTDFTITVTTGQLSGQHKIRIFLPADYATDPGRRWPVAYFLHGGSGSPDDAAAAPALRSNSMITVAPDGGRKGWYADWVMQNTALGAANWETFHTNQVIPYIDANLRTLTDRSHRAVIGLSMGGYGSLHYAEARPDLFGHVAVLSGGIDFGMAEIRAIVLAMELSLTGPLCSSVPSGQCADHGPYVDSDAIFGSPYPIFNADRIWNAVNPAAPANLARLAETDVTLYTGDQGAIDHFTAIATSTVEDRLTGLGIPSRVVNYGDGSALAPTCDGGHNYECWAPAIADYVPRLEASFASAN